MSNEPERPAGEAEEPEAAVTIEITLDTLDDLLGAWGTCVGANEGPPGAEPADAMGLILAYLPAVLEMARDSLIAHGEPSTGKVTRSAHRIATSGQN